MAEKGDNDGMQNDTARVLGIHRDVLRTAETDAEEIFADLRASLGAAPVSLFRELWDEKGSQLSTELRIALAFIAPKVKVGIGASPVFARGLSRNLHTEVPGYFYNE